MKWISDANKPSGGEYLYEPWDIHYTKDQIRWILKHLNWELIKANQWPFHITDEAMRQAGLSHHATFEKISLIVAEMEDRLKSTGPKDGDMCFARYHDEWEDEKIARVFDVPFERVRVRIKRAMTYMAGHRKSCDYDRWIANGWSEIPRKNGKRLNSQYREFSYENKKFTVHS